MGKYYDRGDKIEGEHVDITSKNLKIKTPTKKIINGKKETFYRVVGDRSSSAKILKSLEKKLIHDENGKLNIDNLVSQDQNNLHLELDDSLNCHKINCLSKDRNIKKFGKGPYSGKHNTQTASARDHTYAEIKLGHRDINN